MARFFQIILLASQLTCSGPSPDKAAKSDSTEEQAPPDYDMAILAAAEDESGAASDGEEDSFVNVKCGEEGKWGDEVYDFSCKKKKKEEEY